MKLTLFELRKVWRGRAFPLALLLVVAANLLLMWMMAQPGPNTAPPSAYRLLGRELSGLSTPRQREFLQNRHNTAHGIYQLDSLLQWSAGVQEPEYAARLLEEAAPYMEQYGDAYQSGSYLVYTDDLLLECLFLDEMLKEFEQAEGYDAFLDSVSAKAVQLSGISIFAQSSDPYDLRNIELTANAYQGMQGVTITYAPQKGLVQALEFEYTDAFALLCMLLLATAMVRDEKDGGLLLLVRATPAGRLKTALAKLAAFAASLLAVLLLLYSGNLLLSGTLYGLGDLSRSIQSVPALMRSTLPVNVGQYLGLFLLAKWAASFIMGAWVLLAALLARRALLGWCAALALPAASLAVRAMVPAAGRLNVLKYANLISLLKNNELLGGYRNLYWFGHPVPLPLVEVLAAAGYALVFCGLFCGVFALGRLLPARRQGLALPARLVPRGGTSVLRQESAKLLFMNGAAWVLLALLAFGLWQCTRQRSYTGYDEMLYKQYMLQLEGPYTAESHQYLKTEYQRFAPLLDTQARQMAGSKDADAMMAYSYDLRTLAYEYGIFSRVLARVAYVKDTPGAHLVYESPWPQFLDLWGSADAEDMLLYGFACALCFSALFAVEKSSGMAIVMGATPLGRSHTARRKMAACMAACGVITLVPLLPRCYKMLLSSGFGGLFSPLRSLPWYSGAPVFVSILAFLLFALAARYLAVLLTCFVVLLLSQRLQNTLLALFLSCAVFCLPALLSLFGLRDIRWLGLYPLYHLPALLAQGGQAAALGWVFLPLCAAGAALLYGALRGSYATPPAPAHRPQRAAT